MPLPTFLLGCDVKAPLHYLDRGLTTLRSFRDDVRALVEENPERYGDEGPKDIADVEARIAEFERAISYLTKKPRDL